MGGRLKFALMVYIRYDRRGAIVQQTVRRNHRLGFYTDSDT